MCWSLNKKAGKINHGRMNYRLKKRLWRLLSESEFINDLDDDFGQARFIQYTELRHRFVMI